MNAEQPITADGKLIRDLPTSKNLPARRSFQRVVHTFALWTMGVLTGVFGLIYAVLAMVVPAFSLQNEQWNRPDNPVTPNNIAVFLLTSVACIAAARGSTRTRYIIVAVYVLIGVLITMLNGSLFD